MKLRALGSSTTISLRIRLRDSLSPAASASTVRRPVRTEIPTIRRSSRTTRRSPPSNASGLAV